LEDLMLVRLNDRIAQQREKQIVDRARPHLHAGEEVINWVRARHPRSGRRGVAFLTARRFLVLWSGRPDGAGAVEWTHVEAWGIDSEAAGGPILSVEGRGSEAVIQLPAHSEGVAEQSSKFVRRLATLAPKSRWSKLGSGARSTDGDVSELRIRRVKKSVAGQTRRVVITVLGLVLLIVGVLLLVLPGPGILVTIVGLAVLGSEYDWADDLLLWVRGRWHAAGDKLKSRREAD
jgi:uncharacterized protein (TIGR02611 family)